MAIFFDSAGIEKCRSFHVSQLSGLVNQLLFYRVTNVGI